MKRGSFNLDKIEYEELSLKVFSEISGMNRNGAKARRIEEGGLAMRQKAIEALDIKSQYLFLEKGEFELVEDTLELGNLELKCHAFSLIDSESIEGVYLYVASAGSFINTDETSLKQVYLDLWGTAYVDALRHTLRNRISKSNKISENFGPGFYGMNVGSISVFKELLNFDNLGIRINSSNVMIPLKSCCGLFFVVNDNYSSVGDECMYCMNETKNCKLCSIHNALKEKK
ncbi:MAG: hypothetical protein PUB09_04435 [Firmicutes bacterium]|nr:hypothetical protein [Bacillota bacterium]